MIAMRSTTLGITGMGIAGMGKMMMKTDHADPNESAVLTLGTTYETMPTN